jgi:hypothetical protein
MENTARITYTEKGFICEDNRVEYIWVIGYSSGVKEDVVGETLNVLLKDGTRQSFKYNKDNYQEAEDWISNYKK